MSREGDLMSDVNPYHDKADTVEAVKQELIGDEWEPGSEYAQAERKLSDEDNQQLQWANAHLVLSVGYLRLIKLDKVEE